MRTSAFLALLASAFALHIHFSDEPPMQDDSLADAEPQPKKKYAYAMYADIIEGQTHYLLDLLATIQTIRRVSNETILVFTNQTTFLTGEDVKSNLEKFGNLQVKSIPWIDFPVEWEGFDFAAGCHKYCARLFSKLNIWTMTEYDAVTIMDLDGIMTKNMDHLFEREGTWAQRANFHCKPLETHAAHTACGGFITLHPDMEVYNGMLAYMHDLASKGKVPIQAEQTIINNYFKNSMGDAVVDIPKDVNASEGYATGHHAANSFDLSKANSAELGKTIYEGKISPRHELHMMDYHDANFGHCQPEGSVPAGFVHKMKDCFGVNLHGRKCKKEVRTTMKLGKLWGDSLCQAVELLGIKHDEKIIRHCDS